jgi:hypothetical protein
MWIILNNRVPKLGLSGKSAHDTAMSLSSHWLVLITSTKKLYSDGYEPIFCWHFLEPSLLGDSRNHHFYRRVIEDRQ